MKSNEEKDHVSELPLGQLVTGANYRRAEADSGLIESIRVSGILQPLLVRPAGKKYEIVCGHRRFLAALELELDTVPVLVRTMSDYEALAAQTVENDQREDAHPLDQAAAYQNLVTQINASNAGGLSRMSMIATVAARLGREPSFVYDRIRLLDLILQAQDLFRSGEIMLGHAIVLARLSQDDQRRAIETEDALFTREHVLDFDPAGEGEGEGREQRKARTVRELQSWIDRRVRFDVHAQDLPQLFPDTAAAIADVQEQKTKLVQITFDYHVHPDAKDGEVRTYGPQSWKRADGKHGSKTCENSVLGVIVVGPGRGETFQVCIDKKRCPVHYGAEMKAAARKEKLKSSGKASARASAESKREAKRLAAQRAEQQKHEAMRAQWKKAEPEIYKLVAGAVGKMKVKTTGSVADALVKSATGYNMPKSALTLVKRGKTAEDLVRYLTYLLLASSVGDYSAPVHAPRELKKHGIDVTKTLARFPISQVATKVNAAEDEGGNEDE